ncbi:MAG: T9SS type A sorting domain-containing protein [Saprospiraceae bacterium]|nr:T9SS type A sorting domain-containing protein [Saprospiraceae bacterium]
MKKPIVIALALLTQAFGMHGQQASFPLENARWCYAGYGDQGQNLGTDCFAPDSLLTVSGKTYARIAYKEYPYALMDTLLYREENNRFFVWPQDSAQEILVYDFNLVVGDTFAINWAWALGPTPDTLVVREVDSITTLDGVVRKRMRLEYQGLWGEWIAGMGEARSVFCKPAYIVSVSGGYSFECFAVNVQLVYPDWGPGATCPLISAIGDPPQISGITVYPNPASDALHVQSMDTPVRMVELFCARGERVQVWTAAATLVRVPLPEHLTSGTYWVRVTTQDGVQTLPMLVQR